MSRSGGGGDLVASLLGRTDLVAYRPDPWTAPGPAVPLAVSGGADSLALLVLARAAGLDVVAIHVDHGLRDGSSAEAGVVARAAERFGAGFESRRVVVTPGPNLEARARRARYGALPPGVLTGHTMDDQAETVLLNVMRGAALDGLAGMRAAGWSGLSPGDPGRSGLSPGDPGRPTAAPAPVPPLVPAPVPPLVPAPVEAPGRPLLRLRRAETAALCDHVGLDPVRDTSNDDPRFRRNRIRAEVIPLLCDVFERDVVPILARQAELVSADVALLDELAAAVDPTDARALRATPVPLARRALRRWLRSPAGGADEEAHPPSAAEVARVLAVVGGTVEACQLAGGRRVERRGGRLGVVGR